MNQGNERHVGGYLLQSPVAIAAGIARRPDAPHVIGCPLCDRGRVIGQDVEYFRCGPCSTREGLVILVDNPFAQY